MIFYSGKISYVALKFHDLIFILFICLHRNYLLFIIHSFSVVLDLKTTEVGEDASPMYKEQIASTKIPVTLLRSKHSSLCSACENITSEAVNFLSEKQIQDKIMTILHDTCSQTFSFEQKVIVPFWFGLLDLIYCVCILEIQPIWSKDMTHVGIWFPY